MTVHSKQQQGENQQEWKTEESIRTNSHVVGAVKDQSVSIATVAHQAPRDVASVVCTHSKGSNQILAPPNSAVDFCICAYLLAYKNEKR